MWPQTSVPDWKTLWKEIMIGFLLAGFIGLLGNDVFDFLFVEDAPAAVKTIENVIAGPIIALSFVCSVETHVAAVLYGRISFAGVIAFIFADLIVFLRIARVRQVLRNGVRTRITALMFVTTVLAALVVDGLFSLAGLIPETRLERATSSPRSRSTTSCSSTRRPWSCSWS